MIRAAAALVWLAAPAHAWDFSPTPICTLSHIEGGAGVTVTYDHAASLYAIAISNPEGWPSAPAFSIRFDGAQPNTISTTRHAVRGKTLTVTDAGFGNVLDGLEFNATATAFTQTAAVTLSLDSAAGPVQDFRACAKAPVA
ncbi:hypothetical protein [uncultured Tateyamaria sp.]|uniref:hypothetical protein n=1 Tax=Tateyamaria sp. 1078 TaxID=3417464 RepID=UPI002612C516|nr:hypothetical protein [uncultured Tateyamaria sp.]